MPPTFVGINTIGRKEATQASFGADSMSTPTHRRKKTVRHCMFFHEDGNQPEWQMRGFNKWRKGLKSVHIPDHNNPKTGIFDDEVGALSKHQMKEIKRRQFLAFFTDFFENYKEGNAKFESTGYRFQEKEKARLIDKYYKKYYQENRMPKTKTVQVGMKPGRGKNRKPVPNNVEMLVDTVADENKDAFLGRS